MPPPCLTKGALSMKIAGTVQDSIVDGPGLRFVVFTQGCPHRCTDCHNPETHDAMGGNEMSVSEIVEEMKKNPLTDGLTLSGGEPFIQADDCAAVADAAKASGLDVWTYTGWTYEELLDIAEYDEGVSRLLDITDVLVDGRFEQKKRTLELKFRGSSNQRIIDLVKTRETGVLTQL